MGIKQLLETGDVVPARVGHNLAYLLKQKNLFFLTGFKVLHQQPEGFVRCARDTHNGMDKLVFFTEDYRSLASVLPELDPHGLLQVVAGLLARVIQTRDNGFMSCQNLDLAPDRIMIEPRTMLVQLVYLPLQGTDESSGQQAAFENSLRASLIQLVGQAAQLQTPAVRGMLTLLADGTKSLGEVYKHIRGEAGGSTGTGGAAGMPPRAHAASGPLTGPALSLTGTGLPGVQLTVDRPEYILGSSAGLAHGVVPDKTVSRRHCMLRKTAMGYTVQDLGSANGSFLNGERLGKGEQRPLQNGDRLRLAKVELAVKL